MMDEIKPLRWIATSRKDLRTFPNEVQGVMGFALFRAQQGLKHADARPLKGFGGSGVLEIVDDFDGDTYRAVYTVRYAEIVYVLHAFQKKSKSGIATPKQDMDLIRSRLRLADEEHRQWQEKQKRP
jgi:phage-related protein